MVGFYLGDAPQVGVTWPVGDLDAGRPEGEPVWQTGPQSFVIADGPNGGIVLPCEKSVRKEAAFLSQFPRT